jgi:voltage-gated potassium channel
MKTGRRFVVAAAIILLLTLGGTLGYAALEHMSWLDALYMTVITISTVGFREVRPLDSAGKLFTIALIFTGVGAALYVFASITELIVEGQIRELLGRAAMIRKMHHLHGHVIVCGYGRFGRVVVDELLREKKTVVVIDINEQLAADLKARGILYVIGSAIDEEVLESAGIRTAQDIVAATASDPDNVFISLSAREMNPQIRIHARSESDIGLRHLQLAGADMALSSYHYSAMRIANSIARPSVMDFLTLVSPANRSEEVSLEEIRIDAGSPLIGKALTEIEQAVPRLRVVALKRGGEPLAILPNSSATVAASDLLIAIGIRTSLDRIAEMATGASTA